jgi:hypothetical protein
MMLMDAFLPEGVTTLTVDSIFMMPQLGVLSQVHTKAATDVFEKDCLIYLGTCIAPKGVGKEGKKCLHITGELPGGRQIDEHVPFGRIRIYPLEVGQKTTLRIDPARGFDIGEGSGKAIEREVLGGVVGIIIDTRGRPLNLPQDEATRVRKLKEWMTSLDAYPRVDF